MSTPSSDIQIHSSNAVRNLIALISLLVLLCGYVYASFTTRVERVDTRVDGVQMELSQHKGNTSLHRTAEEAATKDASEEARWQQLFRELDQLNKRMDNLERRAR